MLTVRVAVQVQTHGRDAFVAQLAKERDEVPSLFTDCVRFEAFTGVTDPNSFLIYEEWASRDAFDAYRTSYYFAEGGKILFPLMDGAPDSAYYESRRVGP